MNDKQKEALKKFRPQRPHDYPYLTDEQWLHREIALYGCRSGEFHIKGTGGCWCDFWDAQ